MSDQWLSIAEYARQFHVSDMTVRRRIKSGKINAVLKDGKYFIPVVGTGAADPACNRRGVFGPRPVSEAWNHEVPPAALAREDHQPGNGLHYPGSRFQIGAYPGHTRDGPRLQDVGKRAIPAGGGEKNYGRPGAPPARNSDFREPFRSDTRRLAVVCEGMLTKLEEMEKLLKELFEAKETVLTEKIEKLEEQLGARDSQIRGLGQKIEDMQTLIRMLGESPDKR